MENPQCVLLNFVKVEDSECEVKQEAIDAEDETELFEEDDPLGAEDDMVELGESMFPSSYVETVHSTHPTSGSSGGGGGVGQRRRLRFSDADDRVLLEEVARRDPYEHPLLWREITATVARHAGKAFTARAVREHTDHLMNTFALKGEDACLRRTPVGQWAQKKKLLHQVYLLWKGAGRPTPAAVKEGKSREGREEEEDAVTEASALAVKTRSKTTAAAISANTPPQQQHRSVFLQKPLTLHLNGSQLRMACPPLQQMPSPSKPLQLPLHSLPALQGLQQLSFSPALISKSLRLQPPAVKGTTSASSRKGTAEQVAESVEGASKSTEESVTTAGITGTTVDRGSPPIHFKVEGLSGRAESTNENGDASANGRPDNTPSSGILSQHLAAGNRRCVWRKGRGGAGDRVLQRRRAFALRAQRLRLEERRLALEERRVALEERRWALERAERREQLAGQREQRVERRAVERRQARLMAALMRLLPRPADPTTVGD